MNFRSKIFWLCISVYILTVGVTGFIVISNNYENLLKNEIQRCLKEENDVHSNITIYILANNKIMKQKLQVNSYGDTIVDLFSTKDSHLELYSSELIPISSKSSFLKNIPREEIRIVNKKGKNYVLRNIDGKHYIFISDILQVDSDNIILCFIKDISYVENQKVLERDVFIKIGFIGLVIVALIATILGRIFIRPIDKLNYATKNISAGNYKERVKIQTKDEIGELAEQFNTMADEVENKINELNVESERKQRFIDNLTHELRTPLTSIIGYSDLMMKIKYDEHIFQKGLFFINSEGNRMLKMVNYLMNMILLRENVLEKELIFSSSVLNEVRDILAVKAKDRKVQIILEDSPVKINVDKDLLKEALLNIMDNGINASSEGDTVILGSKIVEGSCCIYVKDQGKGMSQDEKSKILEPFYRVDKARNRKYGGMGLGMYICSEIIKSHEGKLIIESKINEGTIVEIILSI